MTPCDQTSISSQQEPCVAAKLLPAAEKTHTVSEKYSTGNIFTDVNMRISLLMHPQGIDP